MSPRFLRQDQENLQATGDTIKPRHHFSLYVAYDESDIPVYSMDMLFAEWRALKMFNQPLPAEASTQIKDEIADICCQLNSAKFPRSQPSQHCWARCLPRGQ